MRLEALGAREGGTARLEEAAAYREALQERTRARVPLDWAMTQNNLGGALRVLGGWERGTARLEEAVAAYREALQEYTRARVPLEWAMTRRDLPRSSHLPWLYIVRLSRYFASSQARTLCMGEIDAKAKMVPVSKIACNFMISSSLSVGTANPSPPTRPLSLEELCRRRWEIMSGFLARLTARTPA